MVGIYNTRLTICLPFIINIKTRYRKTSTSQYTCVSLHFDKSYNLLFSRIISINFFFFNQTLFYYFIY